MSTEAASESEDLSLLTPGERLRRSRSGCKLSISKWGLTKTLSKEQKRAAAGTFAAQGKRLSASKKIINSDNVYVSAVNSVLARLSKEWIERTDPWIEPGVRLLRTGSVNLFSDFANSVRPELVEAVADLQAHLEEVKAEARQDLGELFNDADYPASVTDRYAFSVDYPSLEPPTWLQGVNPEVYREQSERVRQRFEAAAALGEEVFIQTFQELIAHLDDRLRPSAEGERRIFQTASIENIHAFIQRFRNLYVGNNQQLEELMMQAQQILSVNTPRGLVPVSAQEVRTVGWIGDQVREGMSRLRNSVDGMITTMPRRQFAGDVSAKLNEVEL